MAEMNVRAWHPALGLYLAVAIAALLMWLPNYANAEAGQLLLIVLLVITLPSGLVLGLLLGLGVWGLDKLGISLAVGLVGHLATWASFVAVGFLQWRYLAPWVIRKLQTHT
jgi:hypothetical protein